MTYVGNQVTSVKFLGSGMKYDTSDPDYLKVGDALFNLFITALDNFLKLFPHSLY